MKETDRMFRIIGMIMVIVFIVSLIYTFYYFQHPKFIVLGNNKCVDKVRNSLNNDSNNSKIINGLKNVNCSENIAFCYCQYTYKNHTSIKVFQK